MAGDGQPVDELEDADGEGAFISKGDALDDDDDDDDGTGSCR